MDKDVRNISLGERIRLVIGKRTSAEFAKQYKKVVKNSQETLIQSALKMGEGQ